MKEKNITMNYKVLNNESLELDNTNSKLLICKNHKIKVCLNRLPEPEINKMRCNLCKKIFQEGVDYEKHW